MHRTVDLLNLIRRADTPERLNEIYWQRRFEVTTEIEIEIGKRMALLKERKSNG